MPRPEPLRQPQRRVALAAAASAHAACSGAGELHHRDLAPVAGVGLVSQVGAQVLDGGVGLAQPGQGVFVAQAALEELGHLAQQLVAGVVSEGVVDRLEAVQVEQEDRQRAAAMAGRPRRRPLRPWSCRSSWTGWTCRPRSFTTWSGASCSTSTCRSTLATPAGQGRCTGTKWLLPALRLLCRQLDAAGDAAAVQAASLAVLPGAVPDLLRQANTARMQRAVDAGDGAKGLTALVLH